MDKNVKKLIEEVRRYDQKNDGPEWITVDEKGKKHVDQIGLANSLAKQYKFQINQFSEHGYWYDPKRKQWRNNADDVIALKVKDAITNQGIWSSGLHASVSKLLTLNSKQIVDRDPFDSPAKHKAVFGKHTYDLDTDSLIDNAPNHYILANHSYELDLNGTAPTWNSWLKESLVSESTKTEHNSEELQDEYDPQAVETVKTFIGYALIGSHKEFQHYLLLYGLGGDGKSTLLNWITKIIGNNNVSNIPLDALSDSKEAKFATSKLYHKQANIFADISSKFMNQTNLIKTLTGGDTTTGQFKFHDPFEFMNEAKLFFSCNELPAFSDFTEGMKRRPIIVAFHKIRGFKDKYKKQALTDEMPAFVYECLRAYKKALDQGAFPVTDYMNQQKDNWFMSNDKVGSWLKENCEFDTDSVDYSQHQETDTIYSNYKTYCIRYGVTALSKRKFNVELSKRGIKCNAVIKVNNHSKRGYKGISLKVKYASDYNEK